MTPLHSTVRHGQQDLAKVASLKRGIGGYRSPTKGIGSENRKEE